MSLNILTVDDSKTIRMIVKKAFKTYECNIFEAENGVEGLAVAAREKPDLIVLDITMPVMNGIEMLGLLRAEPGLEKIPVIMLTAESGKENVTQILQKGIADYMVKPFKGEDLIKRAEKVVKLTPKIAPDCTGPSTKCPSDILFSSEDDVQILAPPSKITRPVSIEVHDRLEQKTVEMANSGSRKLILNLGKIREFNISLIKIVTSAIDTCTRHGISLRVVANQVLRNQLGEFQETNTINVFRTIGEAKAAF